jgi:hypothetical protein
MAQHEELGRHAVELLADLFADALEGLATLAVRLVDLVVTLDARQARGQRLAYRLALGLHRRRGLRLALLLGRAVFERGVGQDAIEQHRLRGRVQALAGRAEAPALQARDLEVQRLVPGLVELQLALQPLDQIAQLLHRALRGQRIECVCV